MSRITRPPTPTPPPSTPPGGPPKKPRWAGPQWVTLGWYILMTLAMLWFWQEPLSRMATRVIPYSEFKQRLAQGQVVECTVAQDEIQGKIDTSRTLPAAATQPAAAEAEHAGAEHAASSPTRLGGEPTRAGSANRAATHETIGTTGTDRPPGATSATERAAAPHAATENPPEHPSAERAAASHTAAENPAEHPSTEPVAAPHAANKAAATAHPATTQAAHAAAAKPEVFDFKTVRVEDPQLVQIERARIKFTGVHPSVISQFLWSWIIPIALIWFLWWFLSRRMRGAGQSLLSIGSSKARLVPDTETHVTFDDVAGCDEAKYELQEVVEFLKKPEHFKALGATIPKGVLLVGPPGTGKTLLARAVAGEAKVPFFSISGSEFVEMFVGVGAARVRDLFEKAKAKAPCIVFIDELDAVGRQRGVRVGMVNDEREQTLNQLLVGMDGFEPNAGVVVLAATNRPEVLDHALLRPGRFDRQVVVDAPDMQGRFAILKLHARGKKMAPEADLRRIAQETPGFSGADLANVLNEAALLAARHDGLQISQTDLEEAVEKVVAGPERKSRRLDPEEKRRVAYHETGHALVNAYCKHPDVLHKISVVPHGRAALGYTIQLPEQDRYLMSASDLLDRIKGMLGGRAAEEIIFNEVSTGPENDLERATAMARQMVCAYGMSPLVGLAHLSGPRNEFLAPMGLDGQMQRDCSEQTAREVDEEVKRILDDTYRDAKRILTEHHDQLDLIAGELLKHETMDAPTFLKLIGREGTPTAVEMTPVKH